MVTATPITCRDTHSLRLSRMTMRLCEIVQQRCKHLAICFRSAILLSILAVFALLPEVSGSGEKGQPLVLQDVTVIDGNGRKLDHMDVVIDGDTITKILKHNPDPVVLTPNVINLSGQSPIPGLIDTHQHISNSPEKCLSNALLNGITALRDMGGDGAYLTELQEAVKRGELLAPDIYFSALMGGPELILKDTHVKLSTLEVYDLGSAP